MQCDRTISLNEYFSATSPSQPTVLGLLGCGCSAASQPVAEIIHYNSLSQVCIKHGSQYDHGYCVSAVVSIT